MAHLYLSLVLALWASTSFAQPARRLPEIYFGNKSLYSCSQVVFNAADLPVGTANGKCTVSAGSMITKLGALIGESTDFAQLVDMGGTALIIPKGTSFSTCTQGQVYVNTGNVVGQKLQYCDTTNTPFVVGDVLTTGRSGGQTIAGDTAASGNLYLTSTSNATKGQVRLIDSGLNFFTEAGKTITNNNLLPTAAQLNDAALIASGRQTITLSGTYPAFNYVVATGTVQHSGAAGNPFGEGSLFSHSITYINATAHDFGPIYTVVDQPTIKASGGTARTIGSHIGTNSVVTYTTDYASGGSLTVTEDDTVASSVTVKSASTLTLRRAFVVNVPTLARVCIGGTNNGTTCTSDGNCTGNGTCSTPAYTTDVGLDIAALSGGTNEWPIRIAKHTITSGNPSGAGVLGVETGVTSNQDRLYFKNAAGNIWRMGYSTFTGIGTDGANGGLATATCTSGTNCNFLNMEGHWVASTNSNATLANTTIVVPADIHVFAMACSITVAPGTTSNRTFKLRYGATTSSNISVTFGTSDTKKTVTYQTSGGEAITAGTHFSIESGIITASAAAASGSCTLFYTVDAF